MDMALERMSGVFLASLLGCLLIGQRAIRLLRSLKWIQPTRYEDCPPLKSYQQAKRGTPTMGGLLVLGIAAVAAGTLGGLSHPEGWFVLSAIIGMGCLGLVDDLLKLTRPNAKGLRCWPKLLAALGIGGFIGFMLADPVLGYQRIMTPWLGKPIDLGWLWIPYASVVVAGCAHAVNLTDGMDGLAIGCLAVAFGVLGIVASTGPRPDAVAIWCASLAGASVGFLWFNSFPASVFLGDVGALGLGAALGVLALLADATLLLLVVGGVFVVEALSVVIQVASYRWRNKRRVFRVSPLHHHFQLGGTHEHKLVVRFWIVGFLLAALGLTAFARS
jgi:phospho-N-acetylmuramoyl-pentapeptide-transferase